MKTRSCFRSSHSLPKTFSRILPLLAFFSLMAANLLAQGFTIRDFKADLWLRRDGSFLVEESIAVNFTESKHGIFRDIPFRYATDDVGAGMALGRQAGLDYMTFLDSIEVEGQAFTTSEVGDFLRLRIGSADAYVSGEMRYKIRYKVFGAVNQFPLNDELYWNVNGNGWEVSADKVSITVHMPDGKYAVPMKDMRAFTGRKGEAGANFVLQSGSGTVDATTTIPMQAGEGLTVVMRLPKKMFAHKSAPLRVIAGDYYIDSLHSEVKLREDGAMIVDEWLAIEVINPEATLYRQFPQSYRGATLPGDKATFPPDAKVLYRMAKEAHPTKINITVHGFAENGPLPRISLQTGAGFANQKKYIRLQYEIWDATVLLGSDMGFYLPWLGGTYAKPVRAATATIELPKGCRIADQGLVFPAEMLEVQSDGHRIQARLKQTLLPDQFAHVGIKAAGPDLKMGPIPMRLYGTGEFYEKVHVHLVVERNGRVRVQEKLYPSVEQHPYGVDRAIFKRVEGWEEPPYNVRKPTLLGMPAPFLCGGLESNMGFNDYYWYKPPSIHFDVLEFGEKDSILVEHSYWVYGLLKRENGKVLLDFPIIPYLNAPVEVATFSIQIEGKPALQASDYTTRFRGSISPVLAKVPLTYKDGVLRGQVLPGLANGQGLDIQLRMPEAAVGSSGWLEFRLFLQNQTTFFICILLSLAVIVTWFVKGRNRGFTKVVEFYPPEGVTPAEAGFLYDGVLHNRDILALIYYWGAQGHVRIEETGKDEKTADYRLHKLNDLPKTAHKYEKSLFKGLFEGKPSVTVSSMAAKFYSTMAKVRTELEEHAVKRSYFVPGTRGFGSFLTLLGILLAAIGLLLFLGSVLGILVGLAYYGDIVLGLGIFATVCIVFGRIMYRRAPLGQKQYQKLMGFREFLDKAESDRLRLLVDENPAYFGLTLSYAIGLGMANRWVEKFAPMLTAPPSYYQPSSRNTMAQFDAIEFNRRMSMQLSAMAKHFTSTPAPVKSSSGSSWGGSSYSSSSSSYSSSRSYGSSGGSGFSGGGGYSGGGYGGGGGGSW